MLLCHGDGCQGQFFGIALPHARSETVIQVAHVLIEPAPRPYTPNTDNDALHGKSDGPIAAASALL